MKYDQWQKPCTIVIMIQSKLVLPFRLGAPDDIPLPIFQKQRTSRNALRTINHSVHPSPHCRHRSVVERLANGCVGEVSRVDHAISA